MIRVLAIGREAPWVGPRSGLPIRRSALLRGAARAGPLAYVSLSPTSPGDEPPPEVRTVINVPTRRGPTGARGHLEWQLASLQPGVAPYELTRLTLADPEATRITLEQASRDHDVVWFLDKHSSFLVAPVVRATGAPTILDIEELLADRARQEATVLREHRPTEWTNRLRARARIAFLERNARAWDRWTPQLGAWADLCTVSNPGDAGVIGGTRTVVVPNGCDVPPRRAARPVQPRPVLLFHGLMSYEPNADGAEHLVRDVLPHLDRGIDRDFEVRIVGRATPAVERLADVDRRVTVTGYVDDMAAELDRADVVVVPLRIGSGTRLKILEAMASSTPVVSTAVGCDGLDVVDGEHLLVADDPVAFATACVRALDDAALRTQLVDHAYALVAGRYDWRAIEAQIEALTREVAAR